MQEVGGGARSGTQKDGRAVRYEHRRPELLEALLNHLVDNGLNGQSVRALAESVGVSHVTLRHHFGTREQLLAEVFQAIVEHWSIPFHFAKNDLVWVIRDQWRRWTTPVGQRYFRLAFEVYGLAVSQPDQHRSFLTKMVSDWITLIADHLVETGYQRAKAENLATRILAQIRGLQMDLIATGDILRVEAAFEEFASQLATEVSQTLGRQGAP
jgi:AcrR family transcriptional regulator